MDEALVPVDAQELRDGVNFGGEARKERVAYIRDDDILDVLVRRLKADVTLTCVVDCCHSGTVLDLPYRYTGKGDVMERRFGISFKRLAFRFGGPTCLAASVGGLAWWLTTIFCSSEGG